MMRIRAGVCKAGLAFSGALLALIFAVAWLWNTAFSFSPLVQGGLMAVWLGALLAAWAAGPAPRPFGGIGALALAASGGRSAGCGLRAVFCGPCHTPDADG